MVLISPLCAVAERLRQRPARYGVSGEALVEQADGRFQTQVRKIQIKARQIRLHTQTFIDVHQIRQATDVEVFVGFETLFNAAAGDKQTALHIARTPACRGVNENLLNVGREERAISPSTPSLVGTSRQPTIDKVSRCSSSSTMRRAAAASSGSLFRKSIPTA